MKEAHARKDHRHTVFVRGLNDYVIASGAAWLQNIFHAADGGTVDTVTEWEESIGTEGNRVQPGEPLLLFVESQLSGRLSENVAPICFFVLSHIITQELVNGVVAVGTFDTRFECE